ncbi:laccase precursor [Apiospora saccharicola]
MHASTSLWGLFAPSIFGILATAAPPTKQGPQAPGSCNTPANRGCWTNGFDINKNYCDSFPDGVNREYTFVLAEFDNWKGPDGHVQDKVMLVNGQLPGPPITANWGDTITVHVTNNLRTNGTSMHWHGIHQHLTNIQDGANGATECPLAPGQSKTYRFRATQYGSGWYHSHFSAQYTNGVFGTIQINGPSSANYDIDLGVLPIWDYYYFTADQGVRLTQGFPIPPDSNNILINGTNINPANPSQGKYAVVKLTPGAIHRLHLINPSTQNSFQVSLVGHSFTVIGTDFVPVRPITMDTVFLAVAQRYEVLIDTRGKQVDNYWFNVTLSTTGFCGTSKNPAPAAIFRYDGASATSLPSIPGKRPNDTLCQDRGDYSPIIPRNAPREGFTPAVAAQDSLPVSLSFPPQSQTVQWYVNASSMDVDWGVPTLDYVLSHAPLPTIPRRRNVVRVDVPDQWTYWVVQNLSPMVHPMHLHGHDFLMLGRTDPLQTALSLSELLADDLTGALTPLMRNFTMTNDVGKLNFNNPVRRDTIMLPALGYVVLAFAADNPGNWLFHCHIAWHASGGLAVQFVERVSEQERLIGPEDRRQYYDTCRTWRAYYPTDPYKKEDSGI